MRIGITERGDASLDLSWAPKLTNVDGAILITKNITPKFISEVIAQTKPLIVHATCTGWGSTYVERYVPDYKTQLSNIQHLIDAGFPKERIVLRIDPIIPNEEGLSRFCVVIDEAFRLNLLPDMRIRISVLDEYPHCRERLSRIGKPPFYNGYFQPPYSAFRRLGTVLDKYDLTYESCAEPNLTYEPKVEQIGCISYRDLELMGLPTDEMSVNPQNRKGCLCLSCKTELLMSKQQCAHNCVYCYWKG